MCVHITLNMTEQTVKKKDKGVSVQTSTGLEGLQKCEAPRFQDNRHIKVVNLCVAFTRQEIFMVLVSIRR